MFNTIEGYMKLPLRKETLLTLEEFGKKAWKSIWDSREAGLRHCLLLIEHVPSGVLLDRYVDWLMRPMNHFFFNPRRG